MKLFGLELKRKLKGQKCAIIGCPNKAVVIPLVTPLCDEHGRFWIK